MNVSDPAPNQPVADRPRWFDFKQELPSSTALMLGMGGGLVFLLAWQWVGVSGQFPRQLFPPPTDVAAALWRLLQESNFAADIWASFVRIMLSFAIAAAIALPLGVLMGAFASVGATLNPLISAFRYLPATAFIPLFLMWLGAGEAQKLALLIVGVVFFLISLLMDNTLAMRTELIETARTLGATRRQILWKIVLPASLPAYLDTLRQMLAVGWTYLVVAEIVATTDGIGAMMMRAKRFVHVDEIMAGIVVIGVLGVACDGAFRLLRRLACPYLRYQR